MAAADTVNEVGRGPVRRIVAESEIFQDDRLRSDASGNAQIELVDGTKIVVGPNADIRIDDFAFAGNNTLKQLTVSATRGAFRFISGRSNHAAYKVVTPTGTIGVRGTAFDVTISGGTYVALLSGALRICDRRGVCRNIDDPCKFIFVGDKGISQLKKLDEKLASVETRKVFPLIADQNQLRPQFRRLARGCTTIEQVSPIRFAAVPVIQPPVIQPPVIQPPVIEPPVIEPPAAIFANPGNDKNVGKATESPGKGGFGDTVNGKSDTAGNNGVAGGNGNANAGGIAGVSSGSSSGPSGTGNANNSGNGKGLGRGNGNSG